MELKKMNAIELLKKAEITKEDFKHEVVFKTLFNLINEMICEEDKLENEYHKLKQSRDTWEHIAKNSQKDLVDRIDDIFELRESNKILSTRFDEVFNALKNLYEETEKLKEHCVEQRFIDWEDESIDGCKDLDKALKTAQEYVFNRA